MALAIALLFIFEIAFTAMTLSENVPPRMWWIPGGLFTSYLIVIFLALRTPATRSLAVEEPNGEADFFDR